MTGEATDRSDLQKMQIGEATDLVARLRSPSIWMSMETDAAEPEPRTDPFKAATLIEAQAAEIEGLKVRLARWEPSLMTTSASSGLASRTERADG